MTKKFALLFAFLLIAFVSFSQETSIPFSGNDYFIDAVNKYNIDNLADAEKLFKEALAEDSNNDAAYYYLGLIAFRNNEPDLAEYNLKKANSIDPSNFWYRIRLAQFYADTQRIEVAIQLYEKLTEDYPNKSSLYSDIIGLYADSGQIDKAIQTLDKIESLRGANEATGSARYDLLRMQGKNEEANIFLEEFDKTYSSPRSAYILGDIYKSRFIDSTAISYYNKAISMDPTYTPAYFGLAEVYRMKRQFRQFFDNINIFLSSPTISSEMKAGYMQEVIFNPQFVQAFKPQVDTMVVNILSAHPTDSTALYLAGSYYLQTERKDEGIALYNQNLKNNPQDLRANMEYISLLYYIKDWEKLIEQVQKSLETFKDDTSLLEILGVAYWQSGDIDKAISTYQYTLKTLPKESKMFLSCYSALGDLYHSKGNPKRSYSYYDKALKIDPEYIPVLNNYAYYLSLENRNLKKALAMSKKTIKSEPDNPTYLDTYAWLLFLTGEVEEAKGYFKHAMLYGGKESAVILDHYADVLYALKEYDLAFIYWEQASKLDQTLGISEKMAARKGEIKK